MKTTMREQPRAARDDDGFDDVLRAIARAPSVRPADIDLVGRTVGRFVVQRRLGEGGMGVVYEALDPVLDRKVALKVLRAAQRESAATRAHLHDEARRVAALHHPHLATVYDVGEHDGIVFLALERVSGQPLRARLAALPALTLPRAVATLRAIASGLSCAHAAGIIHRDLKPENVVVGDDGTVKIVDFGIATFSGQSASPSPGKRPAGTRRYMAPEHAAGAPASARADVFAFGVLAREVLAATFPRPRDRAMRAALERLFTTCTGRDPARRPADGATLLAELDAIAAPPRRTAQVGALVLGAAAIAAALGVALAHNVPAPAAAAPQRTTSHAPSRAVTARDDDAPAPRSPASDAASPFADPDAEPDAEPAPSADPGAEDSTLASPSAPDLAGDLPAGARPGRESGTALAAYDENEASTGLPVTAFVDSQGRLVTSMQLDRSSLRSVGLTRGLTAMGSLSTSGGEAEVVTDSSGETVIRVTVHLRPAAGTDGAKPPHVLDPGSAPGDVSAVGIGGDPSTELKDSARPEGTENPAHPSMPNDKMMNLCAAGSPGRVRTFIGPDGELHVLGGDAGAESDPTVLAIIDADGDVISLGRGVTVCGSVGSTDGTLDG